MHKNKAQYFAHETAIVEKNVKIGAGSKVWHHAQIRENAKIGKNCIFGKDVFVDTKVKIGSNVKIQNRASIYQGTIIEDDVFIGPHVVITNDFRPRAFNKKWKIIPTMIKKGSSIGAGAIVVCGVTIGEYSMIGAGSVVTKDVPKHGLVYGNPAELKGYVCSCGNKLDVNYFCSVCRKKTKL